jgi:hypothetical protein
VASDCEPPHVSGDLGRVIVHVRTSAEEGTANIPYYAMWPDGAARWDVDLREPFAWEYEPGFSPPCGGLFERFEIAPLRADSERIDIEWTWSIRGVETCRGELARAARDCSSHQTFRFRWLRACAGDEVLESCR